MEKIQVYSLKITTDKVKFFSYINDGDVIKEADPVINPKIGKVFKIINPYLNNSSENCIVNAYISLGHEFAIDHDYYNKMTRNEHTAVIDTLTEISEELMRIMKRKSN